MLKAIECANGSASKTNLRLDAHRLRKIKVFLTEKNNSKKSLKFEEYIHTLKSIVAYLRKILVDVVSIYEKIFGEKKREISLNRTKNIIAY